MNIILIDPLDSQFFMNHVARGLQDRGHTVYLTNQLPIDAGKYDLVLTNWLSDYINAIVSSVSTIPVVSLAIGTDIVEGAYRQVNLNRIAEVIMFNSSHADMFRQDAPAVPVTVMNWFANESQLAFKERPTMEVDEGGKYTNVRFVCPALHRYMKGLDNVVQMLQDCDCLDLESAEVHIVGPVMEKYLEYYVDYFNRQVASYSIYYHGHVQPHLMDSLIESIDPHFYLLGSQGEMGATVLLESMFKGVNCLVQNHPFDGAYKDAPIYRFDTASQLNEQIQVAARQEISSQQLRNYVDPDFTVAKFCEKLERVLTRVKDTYHAPI